MISNFVRTPIVRIPVGSTFLAKSKASEDAKSWFAGDTARIMQVGELIYFRISFRSCLSISSGWSPTGTRVIPGKSTSVMVRTRGEKIRNRIGSLDMLFSVPTLLSVSVSISILILSKS
eukprot:jgi/Picsp_1/1952/NSC_05418-R1_---NA---